MAVTVETERSEVVHVGFDPKTERLVGDPRVVYMSSNALIQPEASQDGEWIAYRSEAPSEDIYVMRGDGTGRRRLMNDAYKDRGPRWSADAKTITFYSNRDGRCKVWQMSRNGTDMHPIAALESGSLANPCWSPDERVLAAGNPTPGGLQSVFFERSDDGTVTRRDMAVPGSFAGSWSPAGDLIAGVVETSDGGTALAVLELNTGKLRRFTLPDGGAIGTIATSDILTKSWLDEDRFVGRDSNRGRGYIADVRTNEIRWLADPIDGPALLQLVRNGTEMIIVRSHRNTDVWALELGAK